MQYMRKESTAAETANVNTANVSTMVKYMAKQPDLRRRQTCR